MTTYADIVQRKAWLSTEFGEQMARRYFGDEVVDSLPRYIKGQRKGFLKGEIVWRKIDRGGWVRGHGVETRVGKVIEATLQMPKWGGDPEIIKQWVA